MSDLFIDGISIHQESGLFSDVFFRLLPGVDVVYGRNGAGKSQLLNKLRDALNGDGWDWEPTDLVVHASIRPPFDRNELRTRFSLHQVFGDVGVIASPELHCDNPSGITQIVDGATERVRRSHDSDATEYQLAQWREASKSLHRLVLVPSERSSREQAPLFDVMAAFRVEDLPAGLRADFVNATRGRYPNAARSELPAGLDSLSSSLVPLEMITDIDPVLGHPWASIPWYFLASSNQSIATVVALDDDEPVDDVTGNRLTIELDRNPQNRPSLDTREGSGFVEFHQLLEHAATDLVRTANDVYRRLLVDAPRLSVRIAREFQVYSGAKPCMWVGADPSGQTVGLADLSSAQRRWAEFSIRVALGLLGEDNEREFGGRGPVVLVMDEPELALHPTAQRFLALGLEWLAQEYNLTIIVASHSPAFIRPDRFRVHHVSRDRSGRVQLEPLPAATAANASDLGLDEADLLVMTRVFVIVEGRHDELVLWELFGEELDSHGIALLPARGGAGLSSVPEARLLFDFTEAHIVAVVDNVDGEAVQSVVAEAFRLAADGQRDRALTDLAQDLNRRVAEQKFLQEFAIRAIEHGREERVSVFGLSAPDVLDYLPVESLCASRKARGRTWNELRAERDQDGAPGQNFKSWAKSNYSFADDDEAIVNAVRKLDQIHPDLTNLLDHLIGLARSPWQSRFEPES